MVRRYIPQRDGDTTFRIRAGSNKDVAFVRALSTEVFDQFGDYGTFLPTYLNHPSVLTAIGEEHGAPVGFIMLALVSSTRGLPWEGDAVAARSDPAGELEAADEEEDREWLDAEVLAIAVEPAHQAAEVGTRLLQYALSCAEGWQRTMGVRSVQLNVAHTNRGAIRFFDRMGFVEIDPYDGTYPKGQRSIRMARLIDPPR
jgi:ribosomal protein S18 acetylase RimI-like enzyme